MKISNLFYNDFKKLRFIWRVVIFICLLSLAIAPLTLINNTILQFFGAVVILIICLYLNSKYLDKRNFSDYGLVFKRETLTYCAIGVLIGSFSVIFIFLIGINTGILSASNMLTAPSSISLLSFALKMFLVAILEETFFRGYLFTSTNDAIKSKKVSAKKAVLTALVLSSVLFGLAHFNTSNVSIFSIVLLSINGMVWCIPFIMTKNLGMSIGLHTTWNFVQTQIGFTMSGNKAVRPLYNIENLGPDWLTGGAYGPEAGLLGLIGFLTMLLLSLAYLKLVRKKSSIQ
ncbi:CPBP family intramembrane glutamic endopeptidase [Flagellimonas maritima]|uniref:CPBP family intramembrane glutamic endopeptidase n=1 Tax=Flagellimonas maritima TaxID=1383885 RepID=UPI000F4D3EE0|nr:CPBP family intramembrane glutamic endopeptidase [Allomuricauda aurantiaca]